MSDPQSSKRPGSTPPIPGLRHPVQLKRRKKYRLRRRNYTFQPDSGVPSGAGEDTARLQQIERELADARKALAESEERSVRARSDMENQRRRFLKEREDLRKFAAEDLMRSIVPAMDHFGLALKSLDTATDIASVRQGVVMIHRELQGVLEQAGLAIIQPDIVPFDPNFHEAVGTESEPSKPEGHVIAVMRPGWSLNGRVLRPALVKVNRIDGAEANASAPAK